MSRGYYHVTPYCSGLLPRQPASLSWRQKGYSPTARHDGVSTTAYHSTRVSLRYSSLVVKRVSSLSNGLGTRCLLFRDFCEWPWASNVSGLRGGRVRLRSLRIACAIV